MTGLLIAGAGLYGLKKIYGELKGTRSSMNDINQYLSQATKQQCLAMLVEGVYSRDRDASDIPLRAIKGEYEEDKTTEVYTKPDYYWTRMPGVSEEDERNNGLRHYLKRPLADAPAGQYNMNKYRLVIALRGTKKSNFQDIRDNIQVAHHTLHCSRRFVATQNLIEHIVSVFHDNHEGQPSEVCITGHSLGGAIALLIGKELAKDRTRRYDVHCFNPPFLSVLMIIKKCFMVHGAKDILRRCPILEPFLKVTSGAKDLGKMALVFLFGDHRKAWDEFVHFAGLVDWKPILYINKGDLICKEYERFYKWKQKFNSGMPFLPIHMQTLVSRIIKQNAKYSCLVPSVTMVFSQRDSCCHDLKQWYTDPGVDFKVKSYEILRQGFGSGLPDDESFRQKFLNVIANIFNNSTSSQDLQAAFDAEAHDPEYANEMGCGFE